MPVGKMVFAKIADVPPLHAFRLCAGRYPSAYPAKTFSHLDRFLCMVFAQLTFRESLRDTEVCLLAHEAKLYRLGIRGHVARSTLVNANETRVWRIYRDFVNALIQTARKLYVNDAFSGDLANALCALDTTAIDLSHSVFPRPHFSHGQSRREDACADRSARQYVSDGKMHEMNVLDILPSEPRSFAIMDRGLLDFTRLYRFTRACACFVIRPKHNTAFERVYSHEAGKTTGVRCDRTIKLTGVKSPRALSGQVGSYPAALKSFSHSFGGK